MAPSDDAPRALRADAARNRSRLLEAASAQFQAQGFDAPLEGIAEAAGVGIATLYRHFPSREALIRALVDEKLGDIATFARAALGADGDPVDALRAVIVDGARRQAHDRSLSQLWRTVPDAEIQASARELGLYADTEELLRRAQATGGVRADLTVPDVVSIFYAVGGLVEAGHAAAIDRFVAMTLQGVLTAPAGPALPPLDEPG